MKSVFVCLVLFITIFSAFSQKKFTITGKVLEAKNQEPLPFVNVYFQGSTIGTQTDEKGDFTINNIPAGKYRLVASMVSFKPYTQVLVVNTDTKDILITLEDDIMALKELKIVGKRDKEWERDFKEFSLDFLGQNFKKKDIVISNKEVVNFDRNDTLFKASSTEPLIIENRVLGYRLIFILEYFEKTQKSIKINGIPRFEFLTSEDEKQQQVWKKNRIAAYNGSLKHLFKSILYGQVNQQNFRLEYLEYDPENHLFNEKWKDSGKALNFVDSNVVYRTPQENVYVLEFPHRLSTKYWNGNKWLERSILTQKVPIEVDEKGNVFDPLSVEIQGDMSDRRMAKLLPFDFEVANEFLPQNIKIDTIPSILENIYKEPREKIEILNLNPFYFSGEKLQVKFTSKSGPHDNNSVISIPVYVDLLDMDNGNLVKHFKLKLENSQVNLNYHLPSSLKTGNYQLRAYTNWMKNYAEEGFGKFNFTVFSQNYKKEIPKDLQAKLDTVLIHIEGYSNLVLNLKSRILIESKDTFGKPINTSYSIVNSLNKEIITSETDSLGSDFIEFTPTQIDKYKLIAGDKTFDLPAVLDKGIIMTIDNLSNPEKLRVWIQNSDIEIDSLLFTIIKNGKLEYFTNVPNKLKSYIFQVEKPEFTSEFTAILFDKNYKVWAERKIIISDSVDQSFMIENKKTFADIPTKSYVYDRKFDFENNLSLVGSVMNKRGKELYKNVDVTVIISNTNSDSTFSKSSIYNTSTSDKFKIDSLDFYGESQLTYFSNDASVEFDTLEHIPKIKKEKLPIDWKLVTDISDNQEIEKRFANIVWQSDSSTYKPQQTVKKESGYLNILADVKPNNVFQSADIQPKTSMTELVKFVKESGCSTSENVCIRFNDNPISFTENEIGKFPISMLENIEIYKNIDFCNCDCLVVLNTKKSVNSNSVTKKIIIEGYYR